MTAPPRKPRTPLAKLRALCVEHGIYVLSHLDALDKIEPGMSQVELSRRSGLSTSGTGQIVTMMVINELIVCETSPGQGKPSRLDFTPRGLEFLAAVHRMLGYPKEPATAPTPTPPSP
jgi:DNA-binding MarR family transcriptional regulator